MANQSILTVIIPNYNYGEYIIEALLSIEKQKIKPRVIFYDDGLTDDSYQIVKDYIQSGTQIDIRCFKHDKNYGISRTLNDAITQVDTEYYTILSSDDYFFHDELVSDIDNLVNDKLPDLIMGWAMISTDDWVQKARPEIYYEAKFLKQRADEIGSGRTVYQNPDLFNLEPQIRFFRTDYVRKTGLKYDESLVVCEDLLFKSLLLSKGATVDFYTRYYFVYRKDNPKNTVNAMNERNVLYAQWFKQLIDELTPKQLVDLKPFILKDILIREKNFRSQMSQDAGLQSKMLLAFSEQVTYLNEKANIVNQIDNIWDRIDISFPQVSKFFYRYLDHHHLIIERNKKKYISGEWPGMNLRFKEQLAHTYMYVISIELIHPIPKNLRFYIWGKDEKLHELPNPDIEKSIIGEKWRYLVKLNADAISLYSSVTYIEFGEKLIISALKVKKKYER